MDEIFAASFITFMVAIAVISIVAILKFVLEIKYNRKCRNIVQDTSELLKALKRVNQTNHFYDDVKAIYKRELSLPTKRQYDRYDCDRLFRNVVLKEHFLLIEAAEKINQNRIKYASYIEQVNRLKSSATIENAQMLKIPYETYISFEKQLFDSEILHPVLNSVIRCTAVYTSPQGRNSYSKYKDYSIFDVATSYGKFVAEQEKQQEQEASKEYQKKQERAKMTDSLRYDIMRRDGFRCVLCGRSAGDGVELEVDHITPISRGGKTEKSNLRTLCKSCNRGKGAKIE